MRRALFFFFSNFGERLKSSENIFSFQVCESRGAVAFDQHSNGSFPSPRIRLQSMIGVTSFIHFFFCFFFKRASILIPSGPTFEIFHFGSKCSECYFNFCFLVTAFHRLWASCSKPLPSGKYKKRKLHQPKHDISQMEWNHLNVAELPAAHCFVVLPSITAPLKQSKTNKQNNNDKKQGIQANGVTDFNSLSASMALH